MAKMVEVKTISGAEKYFELPEPVKIPKDTPPALILAEVLRSVIGGLTGTTPKWMKISRNKELAMNKVKELEKNGKLN